MSKKKTINIADFLEMFDCRLNELPKQFLSKFKQVNTEYQEPNLEEYKKYILNVLKLINSSNIIRAKKENLKVWERGWRENLVLIDSEQALSASLKPKYFHPSKFLRYNKDLIITENLNLEYDLFTLARYLIFQKYLSPYENIYELGSGSCQNLLMLSEMFPSKKLHGLDWTVSSAKIAKKLARSKNLNIKGVIFDMMNPSSRVILKPKSAVFSIHSLEQLGAQHEKLLSFIIKAKPALVLHYEPILEFYDSDNLMDYLALLYSQRRNYLSGFWPTLCKLKKQKKIEILKSKRPFLGGTIHESSIIAWRPV